MAYLDIRPFGTAARDARFARLMHLLYEMNRDPKKTKKSRPDDWMPDYFDDSGSDQDQPSPQQLREKAKAITRAFGGEVED